MGSVSLPAPKEGFEVVLDVIELDNIDRRFLALLYLFCISSEEVSIPIRERSRLGDERARPVGFSNESPTCLESQ